MTALMTEIELPLSFVLFRMERAGFTVDTDFLRDLGARYTAEIGEKRTLRDAVDVCLWKKINRAIIGFAESRTLLDFVQECRDHLNGGWDLYMI